jgi:hypothetical protein
MTEKFPTNETPETIEGTATHEIGPMMINQFAHNAEPSPGLYIGTTATNGHIITQENYDCARMYAENVREVMRHTRIFGGEQFGCEVKLHCPDIHPESFGTTDCFIFNQSAGHLWIFEYKNGRREVEVIENWQIINYLSGIITRFNLSGLDDQAIQVHSRIVQPRAFHRDGPIREWNFKLSDIRGQINILHENAHMALSENPIIRSGNHCRDCMARYECPAARKAALSLYEVVCQAIPDNISPESLGLLYSIICRAKKQIEFLEEGIGEQLKALIRSGINIPGYTTEETTGRLDWTTPVKDVIALGELLGFDLKKEEVITPTQAKKLGIPSEVIDAYAKAEKRGYKIVPQNLLKARSIFI